MRSHELTTFGLLTFAFSWAFWIPSAVLFRSDATLSVSPTLLMVGLQTIGAVAPTLVAIALTRWIGGRDEVAGLLWRFRPRRTLARWYLVAALTVPTLTLFAMAIRAALFSEPFVDSAAGLAAMADEMGWSVAIILLPIVLASQLFSSPLLEEAGWRGYALPRLQSRHSALLSGIALGGVWGVWHLPLVIAYGDPFGPYLAGIVAHSVLMTWMFNAAGGNLSVMLVAHASLNVSLNVLLPLRAGWVPAIVAWAAVAVIVARHGAADLSGTARFTSVAEARSRQGH